MIAQANSFRIPMRDNSVHCIVTSIPYYNLRDYNLPPLVFGGRSDCRHEWGTIEAVAKAHNSDTTYSEKQSSNSGALRVIPESAFCQLCQAWRGSYGLEPSLSLFVQHSVEVARECKRVLRPDGVMWWNIGDSYATSRNGRSAADGKAAGNDDRTFRDKPFTVDELPAKNLCLVPERIVIALQDDGWIVRSISPWLKKSAMPESCRDRPGTAHEYIFMLTKSPRYYFDMENVRKNGKEWTGQAGTFNRSNGKMTTLDIPGQTHSSHRERDDRVQPGRALRTSDFFFDSLDAQIAHLEQIRDKGGMMVNEDGLPAAFVVNPKGYAGSHYATFPLALVSPMIKCSTSERGCCPKCGAGWVRVVDSKSVSRDELPASHPDYRPTRYTRKAGGDDNYANGGAQRFSQTQTLGWRPSCACPGNDQTVPAIVFDPFCGSGATLAAANELGRRGIGLDLNPVYLAENALPRAEKKMSQKSLGQLPLFKAA